MRRAKLVRDRVPDQLKARGVTALYGADRLGDDEYVAALAAKLVEEAREFEGSLSIEELADVQEVVLALARTLATVAHLEDVRVVKANIRGAFDGRVWMSWEDDGK